MTFKYISGQSYEFTSMKSICVDYHSTKVVQESLSKDKSQNNSEKGSFFKLLC